MEQNTETWLEWRRGGIGSSEAPIIMRVSPWSTLRKLYDEKIGVAPHDSSVNFATARGHFLEPKARAWFELEMDEDFPATVVQHPDIPWLRASLDGLSTDGKRGIEIKAPGKDDHLLAHEGEIPKKYFPQVQHQIMTGGLDFVYYISYSDKDDYTPAVVKVYPDENYIGDLFAAEALFWQRVLDRDPPALVDRDYKLLRGPKWADLRHRLELGFDREAILAEFEGKRVRCGGFYICGDKGIRLGL